MANKNQQQHIGPIAHGTLHEEMHIPQGQPITDAQLHAEMNHAVETHDIHLERQVQFAENARHFNHSQPRTAEHIKNGGHPDNSKG